MEATTRAVDMVKRFEGLRLQAYKDPAGVPTIGYGTTVYPDGDKVRLGESITQSEATEFLAFDCSRFAKAVTGLVKGVALNQNQFDALVSFVYNIGIGAFRESTMLDKLTAKDIKGAAAEFPRWNKATVPVTTVVKGVKKTTRVKKVLPGLVKRRAAERALFETAAKPAPAGTAGTPATAGTAAAFVGPPDEPPPVSVTVLDRAGATVVVLTDATGQVTDILQMPDRAAASMAALLRYYPSLKTFTVAAAGAPVPDGDVRLFVAGPRPVPTVEKAPTLERAFIERGSADGPKFPGNDIKELQARLRDIGYYEGPTSGSFDSATHAAAVAFQTDHFGVAEANGKVGPKTWGKLFPVGAPKVAMKPAPKPAPKAAPKPAKGKPAVGKAPAKKPAVNSGGKTYLYLSDTKKLEKKTGLRLLKLEYVRDGKTIDSIEVYSGVPSRQRFRKGRDSRMGSNEPLPEGRWFIHDILWKDSPDKYYGKVWSAAQGPAKINLSYKEPGRTQRQAIQIHIDGNRRSSPGTAGCVGIRNVADFKTLVAWLRDTDPRDLYVDYGLKTIKRP